MNEIQGTEKMETKKGKAKYDRVYKAMCEKGKKPYRKKHYRV